MKVNTFNERDAKNEKLREYLHKKDQSVDYDKEYLAEFDLEVAKAFPYDIAFFRMNDKAERTVHAKFEEHRKGLDWGYLIQTHYKSLLEVGNFKDLKQEFAGEELNLMAPGYPGYSNGELYVRDFEFGIDFAKDTGKCINKLYESMKKHRPEQLPLPMRGGGGLSGGPLIAYWKTGVKIIGVHSSGRAQNDASMFTIIQSGYSEQFVETIVHSNDDSIDVIKKAVIAYNDDDVDDGWKIVVYGNQDDDWTKTKFDGKYGGYENKPAKLSESGKPWASSANLVNFGDNMEKLYNGANNYYGQNQYIPDFEKVVFTDLVLIIAVIICLCVSFCGLIIGFIAATVGYASFNEYHKVKNQDNLHELEENEEQQHSV